MATRGLLTPTSAPLTQTLRGGYELGTWGPSTAGGGGVGGWSGTWPLQEKPSPLSAGSWASLSLLWLLFHETGRKAEFHAGATQAAGLRVLLSVLSLMS